MLLVVPLIPAVNKNIIKVNDHKVANEGFKDLIHNLMKVLGAFDNPKGITSHS